MAQQVVLSGVGTNRYGETLQQFLTLQRPNALGVASAFVTVKGVNQLIRILSRCGETRCRLVAGTDGAITHPEALYAARENGWGVRLGRAVTGIFHPKMIVAGNRFTCSGGIHELAYTYVGSSNLTGAGLGRNVECGFIADADGCPESASEAFANLWNSSVPATNSELRNYAAVFAESARKRTVAQLTDLGVNDSTPVTGRPQDLRGQPSPRPAMDVGYAIAAWTGLQSFTGEYTFQIEFPRDAGRVIRQIMPNRSRADGKTRVYCPDDQSTRPMKYGFYEDNGMFRLNVPNDASGVEWARENKDGIAIVERGPTGGAPLRLRIIRPGTEADEIIGHSAALGTWGSTPTRAYGWY